MTRYEGDISRLAPESANQPFTALDFHPALLQTPDQQPAPPALATQEGT